MLSRLVTDDNDFFFLSLSVKYVNVKQFRRGKRHGGELVGPVIMTVLLRQFQSQFLLLDPYLRVKQKQINSDRYT